MLTRKHVHVSTSTRHTHVRMGVMVDFWRPGGGNEVINILSFNYHIVIFIVAMSCFQVLIHVPSDMTASIFVSIVMTPTSANVRRDTF